ncbi:hypothetical protein DFH29DRAFT_1000723 [Suillus ampliporus]|nr:hypothetical protein DFH29DRAFT_1000723 [Suillus ampliporus]
MPAGNFRQSLVDERISMEAEGLELEGVGGIVGHKVWEIREEWNLFAICKHAVLSQTGKKEDRVSPSQTNRESDQTHRIPVRQPQAYSPILLCRPYLSHSSRITASSCTSSRTCHTSSLGGNLTKPNNLLLVLCAPHASSVNAPVQEQLTSLSDSYRRPSAIYHCQQRSSSISSGDNTSPLVLEEGRPWPLAPEDFDLYLARCDGICNTTSRDFNK